ncbi:Serine/threonine-protein kinase PrkC [Luteitalea pratensis]|uniref:Serine/threonine-protein kinase PrkC n=1 Tax=Luteitalea pratensis TaxID=1855912 RepID=A0A143PJF4_LUTPR|nr:protein kinase [Luteitalea pratensis]AMY08546.1 Serine/threonine-protein kinase PrkC [Luteitalea pratensis]
MALLAGTRLGIYEIRELVGTGGMGEVYRARDPTLDREVALKILPPMVAADSERLLRFRREARLLASLSHGNIGAVYGFEESDGTHALVLELVDGVTLAERIAGGRIPLEEALPIARQIADALEAAHDRAIIHRDLKPANIKIRPDGTVKVLDFGLAKTLAIDAGTSEAAASPTITSLALTQLGAVLGTAAYMSPEQARGKEADRRSDIWAFGCVLYEMLAGKRAFGGSDGSDTLASVLRSDPDWSALPAQTPHSIRRALRRCLQKDPRQRIRDIADVRLEFEEPTVEVAAATGPSDVPTVPSRTGWVLAVLSLVSLAGLATYVVTRPMPAKEVTRFEVNAPPNTVFGSAVNSLAYLHSAGSATVSPDGTRVVFVAVDERGKAMLWVRAFDSFDAISLAGSDGASQPFWAPDARSIGFFVGKKLKRLEAVGGSLYTICDVVADILRGATWGSGGDIIFASGSSPRLYRVSAEGGAPVPLATHTEQGVTSETLWPSFLPDGRTFLYWARTASGGPGVYVASIVPGIAPKRLLAGGSNAAYDPSGFLLFTQGGVLLRQRFDAARLEVSGETRRVAEGIAWLEAAGTAAFSLSNNGVLVYQPAITRATQFAWFDRNGRMLETVGEPGAYLQPTLSPDGTRLLYTDLRDGNLRIRDLGRNIVSPVTTGPGSKLSPVWSPDGKTIIYRGASDNGVAAFFAKSASGTSEATVLLKGALSGPTQISPDGKWLLYFGTPNEGMTVADVFVLPMTGDRKPQPIVQSPFPDVEPQFSPDGKFVAYVSSETGRREVYVVPFPVTGERWPISNNGGRQPLWRQDGKELFFVSDDRKFYAVDITLGPRFDYSAPRFLFDMRANVYNVRNSYIPSPDGTRFLVNMTLDTSAPPIHVVRNWAAGLKD